jgi:hypothetical protein
LYDDAGNADERQLEEASTKKYQIRKNLPKKRTGEEDRTGGG